MIEVRNLTFSYGQRPILQDISFTAEGGDCVGILGNNGVGKSTLITCLNRLRRPDCGSVQIDGRNVFSMSRRELARQVAYVAQKNEMSQITVYDAILLGRKPYMNWSMNCADYALCDEMMERVGMTAMKLRYVNELSGGEAQKVMLARAFVQQPKILLLDEPTSNLDPRNQYEMMRLVWQRTQEQGITALVVLHDLNLALRYCNRFLFLRRGEVYAYGDASVVTEETLYKVFDIQTKLITYENKKFALIEGGGDNG